jgi:hypothetical protein
MQENLSANYIVVNDIDASGTVNWNNGRGFKSIGEFGNRFTGSFDGQGYTVDGLYINRPNEYYATLFGSIELASVENINLVNNNFVGERFTAGLVGQNLDGTINNTSAEGTIVAGSDEYSNENIDSGGLVGQNLDGTIKNSYSKGTFDSDYGQVGGLVGVSTGTVEKSYSNTDISGSKHVGGVVGGNTGTVDKSYSIGNVTGTGDYVGGVVGLSESSVSESYSVGIITTSGSGSGGVIGANADSAQNLYYDSDIDSNSGIGINGGSSSSVQGLSTSQMQGSSAEGNMDAFDFTDTWSTVEGDYPELQE